MAQWIGTEYQWTITESQWVGEGGVEHSLDAESASFTLTVYDFSFELGGLNAEPTSFVITGYDLELVGDETIDAQPASFTITGYDLIFGEENVFIVEPASFNITTYGISLGATLVSYAGKRKPRFLVTLNLNSTKYVSTEDLYLDRS